MNGMTGYQIVLFLSVDSGFEVVWLMDMLSQYVYVGPDIGKPIILNLYQKACSLSTPTFMAINSMPKMTFQ